MGFKKGTFKLTRKFDGKRYSIYGSGSYHTKHEAESVVKWLRDQGYLARAVKVYGVWVIYQRKA